MKENELTDTKINERIAYLEKMVTRRRVGVGLAKMQRFKFEIKALLELRDLRLDLRKERDDYREALDKILAIKWISFDEFTCADIEDAQGIARESRERFKP